MIKLPEPAKRPTMYFCGCHHRTVLHHENVPHLGQGAGRPDAEIEGIDLPIHAPRGLPAVVQFFR